MVVVPSTFFIGANGVPLEVTGGYLGEAEFLDKVKSVVQVGTELHNSFMPNNESYLLGLPSQL